jgi:phage terminase large subunit-like protein
VDEFEAAEILQSRRKARLDYAEFCRYLFPDEPPAPHHEVICKALDKIISGETRRLMIFCPPGSAKSTYSSVRFPPYFLGRFPKKNIICGSYGEGLATSFGRKVRNIVMDKEYRNLFNTSLAEDARAKGEWETADGGTYFSCGVGSGVTGRRADLGLIDDPVKGQKDADSLTVREDTWNWYKSDFFSRLKPNAAQIIIQTRWHLDDLSGRILPDGWNGESGEFEGFDGQIWTVISMPAQAKENDVLGRKEGEWLWTDFFTPEVWEEIKYVQTNKGTDFRIWGSLYQQQPQPDTGVFFKREWFEEGRFELGREPELYNYAASDYAVSEGKGDFTEHGIGGFDEDDDLWFVDWWYGQTSPDTWIEEQLRLAKKWKPFAWLAEVGVIRRAVEPFLKKAKKTNKVYFRQEWMPHIGDKGANARAFQGLAAMGKVHIPKCEWGDRLVDQLVKFIPNTNFQDDAVDVCGLFGRILDQAFAPTEVIAETVLERDPYGFDEQPEASWKMI